MFMEPGLDFIIKNLPSVLILILFNKQLIDSLCMFVCTCIGNLYILHLPFLIHVSEICIILH